MSDKKNRSVSYVYDEMDPSEKIEFERGLKNDENLLIEVELHKRIKNRLESIQHLDAPQELINKICKQAAQNRKKPVKSYLFNGSIYGVAAAIVLFGLTSGFLLMNGDEPAGENARMNSAAVSAPVFINQTTPAVSAVGSKPENRVQPWIDTNEIIHFHDRLRASGTAPIDSMFENSFRKLTPVTNPTFSSPNKQNLHLTGSRR